MEKINLDPQPHLKYEGHNFLLSEFEIRTLKIEDRVYDGVHTDRSGAIYLLQLSELGDRGKIEKLKQKRKTL